MILPIHSVFNRPGLPGVGVPPMSFDPRDSSALVGNDWPEGAVGVDPVTGEIITKENSTRASDTEALPNIVYGLDWQPIPPVDISTWDSAEPPPVIAPNIIDMGAIRNSHGSQWNYRGSNLTESAFDRWRKAGRPTACQKLRTGCGMGAYSFPDGTWCDPGMSDPRLCLDTTERVLNAITSGAAAANNQLQYGAYPQGVMVPGAIPGGGSVTVSGQASPMAWIFGGLIVVGLIYVAGKR